MWREDGAGELYTYLPMDEPANQKLCSYKPGFSECNPKYGASVGRGNFHFARGEWTIVTVTVKLNDVGEANGSIRLRAGGKTVVNVDGVVLRTSENGKIRGMQCQTFFGGKSCYICLDSCSSAKFVINTGSGKDWASPKTQEVYFSDFTLSVTQTL